MRSKAYLINNKDIESVLLSTPTSAIIGYEFRKKGLYFD